MSLLADQPKVTPQAILLATPTLGMISYYWHTQVAELFRSGKPMNRALIERGVKGGPVDRGRNLLTEWALGLTDPVISHMFFVDDDVIIRPDSLITLLAHDRQIVAGLYYAKTAARQPLLLREPYGGAVEDWEPGSLVDCYAHGMGCTLIAREVFEAIEPPWFKTTINERYRDEFKTQTEDVYFCERAAAAGFQPCVDTSLRCLHYDKTTDTGYPEDWWAEFVGSTNKQAVAS